MRQTTRILILVSALGTQPKTEVAKFWNYLRFRIGNVSWYRKRCVPLAEGLALTKETLTELSRRLSYEKCLTWDDSNRQVKIWHINEMKPGYDAVVKSMRSLLIGCCKRAECWVLQVINLNCKPDHDAG